MSAGIFTERILRMFNNLRAESRSSLSNVAGAALTKLMGITLFSLVACSENPGDETGPDTEEVEVSAPIDQERATSIHYTEVREACVDQNPNRNAYFGDVHVHTSYSWDANANGTRTNPDDAYRFAKGEEIDLPPYDASGRATQRLKIDRPLDFVSVTDHSEFLGEISLCTDAKGASYNSKACRTFREEQLVGRGSRFMALPIASWDPQRNAGICGKDGEKCRQRGLTQWEEIQKVAEIHYDRSGDCSFTTFVGYEYTGLPNWSSYHRNVLFRNANVPELPVSYIEAPKEHMLWDQLRVKCLNDMEGCDVLAIPHNANLSNGHLLNPVYPDLHTLGEHVERAQLRQDMEPLVEIFQHKGNSECFNNISGVLGEPDELCDFEQPRRIGPGRVIKGRAVPATEDCGDGTGAAGILNGGCVSRHDFIRSSLLVGLQEDERLGVNPFKYGVIASTDTHLSIPGAVSEAGWKGHLALEATLEKRLAEGITPSNLKGNAGGLAGIWAVENSRDALFNAMKRRETFGTSGPRIKPRFFGGWSYKAGLCNAPDLVDRAYAGGVPMGGDLPVRSEGAMAPGFVVTAVRDSQSAPLQKVQVIKGWISEKGEARYKVYDVAGDPDNGARIDMSTGEPVGPGYDSLCAVFVDPDFDTDQPAYYYARVVENPTARWSFAQCVSLPQEQRLAACDNDAPKVIQEMAWTSPIWYNPASRSE